MPRDVTDVNLCLPFLGRFFGPVVIVRWGCNSFFKVLEFCDALLRCAVVHKMDTRCYTSVHIIIIDVVDEDKQPEPPVQKKRKNADELQLALLLLRISNLQHPCSQQTRFSLKPGASANREKKHARLASIPTLKQHIQRPRCVLKTLDDREARFELPLRDPARQLSSRLGKTLDVICDDEALHLGAHADEGEVVLEAFWFGFVCDFNFELSVRGNVTDEKEGLKSSL